MSHFLEAQRGTARTIRRQGQDVSVECSRGHSGFHNQATILSPRHLECMEASIPVRCQQIRIFLYLLNLQA